jgi:hypothetical protein
VKVYSNEACTTEDATVVSATTAADTVWTVTPYTKSVKLSGLKDGTAWVKFSMKHRVGDTGEGTEETSSAVKIIVHSLTITAPSWLKKGDLDEIVITYDPNAIKSGNIELSGLSDLYNITDTDSGTSTTDAGTTQISSLSWTLSDRTGIRSGKITVKITGKTANKTTLKAKHDESGCEAELAVGVYVLDLVIDEVDEYNEKDPGVFLAVKKKRKEVELKVEPTSAGGSVKLTLPEGLKLYDAETGGNVIDTRSWAVDDSFPKTFYAEGESASADMRDKEVKLEWDKITETKDGATVSISDIAKATVVTVSISAPYWLRKDHEEKIEITYAPIDLDSGKIELSGLSDIYDIVDSDFVEGETNASSSTPQDEKLTWSLKRENTKAGKIVVKVKGKTEGESTLKVSHFESNAIAEADVGVFAISEFKVSDNANTDNYVIIPAENPDRGDTLYILQDSDSKVKIDLSLKWSPADKDEINKKFKWKIDEVAEQNTTSVGNTNNTSAWQTSSGTFTFDSTNSKGTGESTWTKPEDSKREYSVTAWFDVNADGKIDEKEYSHKLNVVAYNIVKIPLGGSVSLNKYVLGKVYEPTKFGGKLTISGDSSSMFYIDGSDLDATNARKILKGELTALTSPYEVPLNKHGWYYVHNKTDNSTLSTVKFSQIAESEKKPWYCSWYPMVDEMTTNNLHESGGTLAKYDRAYGTRSREIENKNFVTEKGHFFAKSKVIESDAERTVGYDYNNIDNDNNTKTGWDANVTRDFLKNTTISPSTTTVYNWGRDGRTDGELDVSWYGHCDMSTAVIIVEKEPSDTIVNVGGIAFDKGDKKGLLVALYHGFDVDSSLRSFSYDVTPCDWHPFVEQRLFHEKKMFAADITNKGVGRDTVWNYPIYKVDMTYKESDGDDEVTKLTIKCKVSVWKEGTNAEYGVEKIYDYDVTYNTSGVLDTNQKGKWTTTLTERPDSAWIPIAPTTVWQFWQGQLDIQKINFITGR